MPGNKNRFRNQPKDPPHTTIGGSTATIAAKPPANKDAHPVRDISSDAEIPSDVCSLIEELLSPRTSLQSRLFIETPLYSSLDASKLDHVEG